MSRCEGCENQVGNVLDGPRTACISKPKFVLVRPQNRQGTASPLIPRPGQLLPHELAPRAALFPLVVAQWQKADQQPLRDLPLLHQELFQGLPPLSLSVYQGPPGRRAKNRTKHPCPNRRSTTPRPEKDLLRLGCPHFPSPLQLRQPFLPRLPLI